MTTESTAATARDSLLLRLLPELFRSDSFLINFLDHYEKLLADLDNQINNLHLNFDPASAPEEMLDWLSGWVDVELDPSLPQRGRRNLLRAAIAQAYRRGTNQGLKDSIAAALCLIPEAVRVIDRPTKQQPNIKPYHILVEVDLSQSLLVDESKNKLLDPSEGQVAAKQIIMRIIEAEKPAHTYCELRTLPSFENV